jgi:hypothetical protein
VDHHRRQWRRSASATAGARAGARRPPAPTRPRSPAEPAR